MVCLIFHDLCSLAICVYAFESANTSSSFYKLVWEGKKVLLVLLLALYIDGIVSCVTFE